ncbi:MAG: carboxypeptidase-like regulatory domain-containing protein, partial [bacterium]
MLRKILYLSIFIFLLPFLAFGEETTSSIITVGKVYTKWKGFLNIPFWTDASVSFNGISPVTLPKEVTAFQIGLDWRGENETRASQKCTIITRIEAETYPNSGKWTLLFEEANEMIGRGGVIEERPIVTRNIPQEKPEVRYKITVRATMPLGQEQKPEITYLTVLLTSKAYTTYTSIPILPIMLLHDPNGDESYITLQPNTSISHLLSINLAGLEAKIENQQKVFFETQKAKIEINPMSENTVMINFISKEAITSAVSKDPCLIGTGLGDTYVVIKDLPIKFNFSKAFTPLGEEKRAFSCCIVSPQEAGLSPERGFDVVLIPAAALRSYDKECPIFGNWGQLGLDDQMRQQLIEMNIGWDNMVSPEEKDDVIDLGEGYLNFKDQTRKDYTQVYLNKVSFFSEMVIEPYFATTAGIPVSRDKMLTAIILNESPVTKSVPKDNLIVTLEDDDRQNIPGDFFTYQFYLDKRFGSLLVITKDDKTKPQTLDSLYTRSFSSNPKEYWTEDLKIIPVEVSIKGLVTSTTGEGIGSVSLEVRLDDKVVKEVMTKAGGTYTIDGLIPGNKYVLIPNIAGYQCKTIEIEPFSHNELIREINVVLEPIVKEVLPEEKVIVEIPPAPLIPEPVPPKPEIVAEKEISELLVNSNFSSALDGWKLVKIGAGKEMYASVIRNDFTYPYALEIKRTGSNRVRGEMGVRQVLNKDVSGYTQL